MSSPPRPTPYDTFVITAPGLEALAAKELTALGLENVTVTDGGVTYRATRRALYEANLHLRTASRIIVRAAEFAAKTFHELERRARKVPWEAFVSPNLPVALRVTCRKSRLYHSGAVAERVSEAIASRVGSPSERAGLTRSPRGDQGDGRLERPTVESDTVSDPGEPPDHQLVLVRLLHDRCTVSIDSSGALLHLRGYRQATGKAPMRETLAAAALAASGWHGQAPLLDPMCGSGTIPIEAALIARRIAPGLRRRFAFENWPDFDAHEWSQVVAAAQARAVSRSPVRIIGSDRDDGAIEASGANATRAGVADDIELSRRSISAIEPPGARGWVVSNPPYGVRVGEADRLRNLYAQFGNVVRAKCSGWRVTLVSADPGLERHVRLGLEPVLRTTNGGIKVRVVVGDVPTAGHSEIAGAEPDTAAQRYPS